MTIDRKFLLRLLGGSADANITFSDLCRLMLDLGFKPRIKGDHHIFHKEGIPEILNLQPRGKSAKPYQVKQVRNLILKYKLGGFPGD